MAPSNLDIINVLCKRLGMTYAELAKHIGVSRQTVNAWQKDAPSGKPWAGGIPVQLLLRTIERGGFDAHDLLFGEPGPEAKGLSKEVDKLRLDLVEYRERDNLLEEIRALRKELREARGEHTQSEGGEV